MNIFPVCGTGFVNQLTERCDLLTQQIQSADCYMVNAAGFIIRPDSDGRAFSGQHPDIPYGHIFNGSPLQGGGPLGFKGCKVNQIGSAVPKAHLRIFNQNIFKQDMAHGCAVTVMDGDYRLMESMQHGDIPEGDINEDEVVNTRDFITIIKMIIGQSEKSANADLNKDGNVDASDLMLLKKILAK